ncbi:lasso peptide biosynthesis B2 protein [Lentzea terrae]|uniref:lasso peptide biosynthesis B2 protein n=1 Tax=Lentzea terrae TaxID=2200761 RepID=UPI001E5E12B3|nr:lasso peptide biosynthesis B2 protein [Lentzea terrae]
MIFRELKRSGDLELALSSVAHEFPSIPLSEIRTDVDRLVSDLLTRGLLVPSPEHVWHAGGTPVALPSRQSGDVTAIRRVLATLCLLAAIAILRLPFRTTIRFAAAVKRMLARRTATRSDGRKSVSAVHQVGRSVPLRVACLETSLASVLLCALYGQALEWCFGHSLDPIAFHSWVEADGEPVRDPHDEPIDTAYKRIFAV